MADEQNWTVVDNTGEVIAQVITSGTHPRFHGFDWDGATMTARMTERQGDPASERFVGGEWRDDPTKIDARMHARIDAGAGVVRLRFITDVPGQAAVYERKEREARAWLAAAPAEQDAPAKWPFLTAEAEATGATRAEAAQAIIAAADQWDATSAAIEKARIGAKRAVSAAATRTEKRTAAQVDWEGVLNG